MAEVKKFLRSFVVGHDGLFSSSKFFATVASVILLTAYVKKEVISPGPLNPELLLCFAGIFITNKAVSMFASYKNRTIGTNTAAPPAPPPPPPVATKPANTQGIASPSLTAPVENTD